MYSSKISTKLAWNVNIINWKTGKAAINCLVFSFKLRHITISLYRQMLNNQGRFSFADKISMALTNFKCESKPDSLLKSLNYHLLNIHWF